MHSLSRSISHLTLALAVAVALLSTCLAQEVASVDLTKIQARIQLRHPRASSPVTGGGKRSVQAIHSCHDSAHDGVALRASVVSLDRTHYEVEDTSKFEVTVENTGLEPIKIPFSPHLADLQPKDPAQKFSYSELAIVLWIAGGKNWWSNSGGSAVLYGGDDHPGTMLSLQPGQWARIIGEGRFGDPSNQLNAASIRSHPADRVYAEALLYRDETLITSAQTATVEREICVAHTPGQSIPIQLTVP
jgi:hypothetical protein